MRCAYCQSLRSRVEALESVVKNLVREGTAVIAAIQSGSDSAQETAALDWLDTVEEALSLLAPCFLVHHETTAFLARIRAGSDSNSETRGKS